MVNVLTLFCSLSFLCFLKTVRIFFRELSLKPWLFDFLLFQSLFGVDDWLRGFFWSNSWKTISVIFLKKALDSPNFFDFFKSEMYILETRRFGCWIHLKLVTFMEIIAVTDYKKLYMRLKQFSKNKYIAIWLVVLKTIYINRRIRPFTLLYILFPSSRSPHSCFSIAKYAVIGQKPFRRPSRFSPFFHNLSEWGHIDFFNKPLETV